jgi:hypothetical protein
MPAVQSMFVRFQAGANFPDTHVWMRRKALRSSRMLAMDVPGYEEQLAIDKRNAGAFYDRLGVRYAHCTTCRGLFGIVAAGEIVPNRGQFKGTFTKNSYTHRNGYVAIFDFVTPTREAALSQVGKVAPFFCVWEPFSATLDLEPDWVESRIIRARDVSVPLDVCAIPVLEAWIAEPITLPAISAVRFFLNGHVAATVERPLTIDKLHNARIAVTQGFKLGRRHTLATAAPAIRAGIILKIRDKRRGRHKPI